MRHIAHLMSTDARRFKLLIALWLLTELAVTILAGVRPRFGFNAQIFETMTVVGSLLKLFELLLMSLIVPLVIQADSPVGTTAFWLTRPIAGKALVTAKAAVLWLSIIAAPLVLHALLMAINRVPGDELVKVLVQDALVQTLWLLGLIAAASVVPTVAWYAALCGGVLLAFAVYVTVSTMLALAALREEGGVGAVGVGAGPAIDTLTDGIVLMVLLATASILVIGLQYSIRSRRRSVGAGILVSVLAFVIAPRFPWQVFEVKLAAPDWAVHDGNIRLTSTGDRPFAEPLYARVSNSRRSVHGQVQLSGTPNNWSARVRLVQASLTLENGRRFDSWRWEGGQQLTLVDGSGVPYQTAARLLDVEMLNERIPQPPSIVLLSLREEDYEQVRDAPGRYEGRFALDFVEDAIDAVVPLTAGAAHQRGAYRIVVERTSNRGGSFGVVARISDASSIFDRGAPVTVSYYLRNRASREAISGWAGHIHEGVGGLFARSSISSGFSLDAYFIGFSQMPVPPNTRIAVDDRWLAGAELVIVRSTTYPGVERTLAIDGFSIRPDEQTQLLPR